MKKLLFTLSVGALLMTSCGGGSENTNTEESKPKIGAAEDESNKKDIPEVVEITITGNDQMKYDLSRIDVYEGQTVKLTLVHGGEMAKEAMGHNWVLLKKGVSAEEFAADAAASVDTDYIPENRAGDIIAHTKTLGGGESTTIEFTAPEKGTYNFICSFPGHFGMMNGKLAVN